MPATFRASKLDYRRIDLHRGKIPAVVIEAYAANSWERYAYASISMKSFDKSLPGKDAYQYFGFDGGVIAKKVEKYFGGLGDGSAVVGECREL